MRNPLSIEAFAGWVETMPADAKYNYANPFGCAFCAYLTHLGFPNPLVTPSDWTGDHKLDGTSLFRPLPNGVNVAVHERPWTYGALATRLRASLNTGAKP